MRLPVRPGLRFSSALTALFLLGVAASACKKSVGEVRTIDVASDVPADPTHPAQVTLVVQGGEIHVTPGGAHVVGGSVRSNFVDLDPKTETMGDQLRVSQGGSGSGGGAGDVKWSPEFVADWRLTVGPQPMSIEVQGGNADTQLELGGVALKSLRVKTATGPVRVRWGAGNPLSAELVELDSASGAIIAEELGRFGASKARVHSGTGAITVDLGAKVDRDLEMDVEAGTGTVTVKVPPSVPARARLQQGKGDVKAEGWTKDGDAWVINAPGPVARVTLMIKAGTGAVRLIGAP